MISILPPLPRNLPEEYYLAAGILRRCFPDRKETIDSVILGAEGCGSLENYRDKFMPESINYSLTLSRKSRTIHKYLSENQDLIPEGLGLTEFLNGYISPFFRPMYVLEHEGNRYP